MNKETMVEKVKNLLSKTIENGCTEQEAKTAMLMAQKLMAKYNLEHEDVNSETKRKMVTVKLHVYAVGSYRVSLAAIIAKNFCCEAYVSGKDYFFIGYESDANVAKQVFDYAYRMVQVLGGRIVRSKRKEGLDIKGVFPAYATGFCGGIKKAFDKQCTALMIVTAQEVKDAYAKRTKGGKAKRQTYTKDQSKHVACWSKGFEDGKSFAMNDKKGIQARA